MTSRLQVHSLTFCLLSLLCAQAIVPLQPLEALQPMGLLLINKGHCTSPWYSLLVIGTLADTFFIYMIAQSPFDSALNKFELLNEVHSVRHIGTWRRMSPLATRNACFVFKHWGIIRAPWLSAYINVFSFLHIDVWIIKYFPPQSLGLCTATVMFVLSQDRLNMDLDRESLELMLNLLESDASHK